MQVTRRQEKQPIDIWVRRTLHAQYDSALREPVPDDMIRLVEAAAIEG